MMIETQFPNADTLIVTPNIGEKEKVSQSHDCFQIRYLQRGCEIDINIVNQSLIDCVLNNAPLTTVLCHISPTDNHNINQQCSIKSYICPVSWYEQQLVQSVNINWYYGNMTHQNNVISI